MPSLFYIFIIIVLLLSFVTTLILIKLLVLSAHKLRLIDYPDNRKMHDKEVPLVGGAAIFLVFTFFMIIWFGFPIFIKEIYLVLSTCIIFMVGIYDDIKGLSAYKKMLFQFLASLLLIYGLNLNHYILFSFLNYYINIFILICFIMGITNSINLIDGIDGLAGGLSIIISITFIIFNIMFLGYISSMNYIPALLVGSLLAFVIYNKYPAKIFLGDSGSLFLGCVFTIISLVCVKNISASSSIIIPFIIIGIPAFDVLFVMQERFFNPLKSSLLGRILAMFVPDDRHIHYLFIKNGYSKKYTVIILCFFNILFSSTMIVYYYYWKLYNIFFLLFILLVLYYFIRNFLIKNLDKIQYEK